MYFTKAKLSKNTVSDCDIRHKAVMGLFPHVQTAEAARDANILYFVNKDNTLLIQSDSCPVDSAFACTDVLTKDMSSFEDSILAAKGSTCTFELVANPRTTKNVDGKSKKVLITDRNKRFEWLGKNIKGALILQVIEGEKYDSLSRNKNVTVKGYEYTGLLKILDPEVFLQTVREGVGPGKAYGYGLLRVMRCRA